MVSIGKYPDAWTLCQIKDIGNVVSGGTPSTKNTSYWGNEVAWITPADLSGYKEKYISRGRKSITELGLRQSSARLVPKGSVLFSSRAPIGYVVIASNELSTNQGFKNIVPFDGVNSVYVYYFLKHIKELAVENASGTTFKEISGTKFSELPFLLPSIDEQERIVAKIEELFSELDAGVESLKKAQAQLKTYRQAVLKAAFDGKLTNETIIEGKLPKDWKLVKLADVATSRLGKMLDRTKNVGHLQPYLRNINVRWGSFDLSNLLEMRFEKDEADKFGLKQGDLVICEGGEPGRAAIWREADSPMKIQKALHRVRFANTTSPTFFLYFLVYSARSKSLDKYFTGTTIKHLTGESLRQIELPFPPIEEQQRIINEIESRLSVCDKLEESIAASLKQSEALRQSILKKAFEGNLVEQDENDEPIAILLERLDKERKEVLAGEKLNKENPPRVSTLKRMGEKLKSILQLLEENGEPIGTYRLWQSSEYKNDIDKFYAEVKNLLESGIIRETARVGKESFLVLTRNK